MSEPATQAALDAWSFPFWATSGLLASGLLYLRGFRRIRRTRPHLFPSWRAWSFLGGLLSLYIAVGSPIDALDDVLLSAHMTQHLIFMSVAPPLLLLGSPVVPFLRSLPRSLLRGALGPLFRMAWLHRLFRLLTHPVFAFLEMNITFLGWHIPYAYELALSSDDWHAVEHGCFLFTGLLFWFPLIQPWPRVSQASRWVLLPYLAGADLVNTVFSASLTFSSPFAAAPAV